jgi:hypothetical protein
MKQGEGKQSLFKGGLKSSMSGNLNDLTFGVVVHFFERAYYQK